MCLIVVVVVVIVVLYAGVLSDPFVVCTMVHFPYPTCNTFLEVVSSTWIHIYTGKNNEVKVGKTGKIW